MALKRLILIRAAETDWNLNGRWQGWAPVPLNQHGWDQVYCLAGFIRNIGLTQIYSSDNRRAVQTAEVIAEKLDFDIQYDQRLRERHIGHWQGLVLPEIREWYADEYAEMLKDISGYKISGGESLNDVTQRAEKALADIIKKANADDSDHTVGIVTHTTTIRVILEKLVLGADLSHENFGNSSATTVRHNDDGTWKLIATNDTSHLEGLESRYMPEVEHKG